MNTLEILAIIINIVLIWLFIKGYREDEDWTTYVALSLYFIGAFTLFHFIQKYWHILTTPLW